jgi:uncharacterized protein with HEPN domain
MRKDDALLLDMLIATRRIQQFTAGMNQGNFNQNEMAQSAVIREIQVIGEAARLIAEETKAAHDSVAWRAAGIRNRVIHEYFNIDLDILWDTIRDDIPPLIEQLERIVPPEDTQKDDSP